jgi:hypothetical protein
MLTQEQIDTEGVTDVIPQKRGKTNTRPGITSLAVVGTDKERRESMCWLPPVRKPTTAELRKLVGIMVETVLLTVMNNHFYQFGDRIRRQLFGGAIGLRSTGVVAKYVMKFFDRLFLQKLDNAGVRMELYKRYVDDLDVCCRQMELGTRYRDGKLTVLESDKLEDVRSQIQSDKLAMDTIRQIGDTVLEFIKLTSDCPSDNMEAGGYMPILDLQCCVQDNRVVHKFYEKPMNTKYCILNSSAGNNHVKFTTLTQECVRRLMNCNEGVTQNEKTDILQQFVLKMRRSGYDSRFRYKVILAAKGIYDKKVKDDIEGKPLYRERKYRVRERRLMAEKKKTNWYKRDKQTDRFYLAPLIVDPTPGGSLKGR